MNVGTDVQKEIEEMEQQDMQNLNLFGLPEDLLGQEDNRRDNQIDKHNAEIKRMVREMIQDSMNRDPEGNFKNFGARKSYSSYDVYSMESQYASLRYEDSVKLRASIVIDQQRTVLREIKHKDIERRLSHEDRDRLAQVQILLDRLGDIKIIDAPVLLKLYNLYRYDFVE